jgi:hypothetical protein
MHGGDEICIQIRAKCETGVDWEDDIKTEKEKWYVKV